VELFSDETEKPRGCGIIEFENALSAKKAIEKMHRFELGGRKIVVKEVRVVKYLIFIGEQTAWILKITSGYFSTGVGL
jgi:RNA recognition motif-containing protein